MKFIENRWFLSALRIVISGVFIYAGMLKVMDPFQFSDSIASFEVLPPLFINLVALTLPPFEIFLGILLFVGPFERPAAFGLLILTSGFAAILIQAILRGLQVDCGCFGGGESSRWSVWISLGRDLLVLIGVIILYNRPAKSESRLRESGRPVLGECLRTKKAESDRL